MGDLGSAARGHRGAKGRDMSAGYYRLLIGVAASVSLMVAGCGSNWPNTVAAGPAAGAPSSPPVAKNTTDQIDTEATVWTVLGFAKRESEQNAGPQTGNAVSPILWQATQDTLHFAGVASEDPMTGLLMTNWYSPPGKPNERLRVSVFILSRALRSDSLAVTVERQARSSGAGWGDTPVARDVVTGLETAILQRARQIRAERYRDTVYK
jgi:uncharacterized protein DUF3576